MSLKLSIVSISPKITKKISLSPKTNKKTKITLIFFQSDKNILIIFIFFLKKKTKIKYNNQKDWNKNLKNKILFIYLKQSKSKYAPLARY
jgi:hypothetical protein